MDMLILVLNVFKVNSECLHSGIFIVNFEKNHHKVYQIKLMFLMSLNMYLPARQSLPNTIFSYVRYI